MSILQSAQLTFRNGIGAAAAGWRHRRWCHLPLSFFFPEIGNLQFFPLGCFQLFRSSSVIWFLSTYIYSTTASLYEARLTHSFLSSILPLFTLILPYPHSITSFTNFLPIHSFIHPFIVSCPERKSKLFFLLRFLLVTDCNWLSRRTFRRLMRSCITL